MQNHLPCFRYYFCVGTSGVFCEIRYYSCASVILHCKLGTGPFFFYLQNLIWKVTQSLLQYEDHIITPTHVSLTLSIRLLGMEIKICNNVHSSRLGRCAIYTEACCWWFCKLYYNLTMVHIISHLHLRALYFTITVFWVWRQFTTETWNNAQSKKLGYGIKMICNRAQCGTVTSK